MGTTAEDVHRALPFKGGLGPMGLSQNRCLVIVEEQNEDCDDDVISEEEDKRLMEGRNGRGMNEADSNHSGVNSSRSSTSTECWMNTYRKLRRASELIGASAVAIDNKIEMAMDLVKNHLMFAVREEMEQMRDQIRGLTERNKQLEEENTILRASTTPENLSLIFNNQVHSTDGASKRPQAINNNSNNNNNNSSMEMTKHWLSSCVQDGQTDYHQRPVQHQQLTLTPNPTDPPGDRPRTPATLIPIAPQFVGQVLTTPTIGVAGIHLSASPSNSFNSFHFNPSLVQPFQFSSKPTQFVSSFDPRVSSSSSPDAPSGPTTPHFLLIKPDFSPESYGNVAWTPTNEYNIILTGSTNQNLQQQQQLLLQQQHHHQQLQQQQQQQQHTELPRQN